MLVLLLLLTVALIGFGPLNAMWVAAAVVIGDVAHSRRLGSGRLGDDPAYRAYRDQQDRRIRWDHGYQEGPGRHRHQRQASDRAQ